MWIRGMLYTHVFNYSTLSLFSQIQYKKKKRGGHLLYKNGILIKPTLCFKDTMRNNKKEIRLTYYYP